MNTHILTGNYHDGVIELFPRPKDLKPGQIRLLIMPDNTAQATPLPLQRPIAFGMLRSATGQMSTEEDFTLAQWHGEPEFESDDAG